MHPEARQESFLYRNLFWYEGSLRFYLSFAIALPVFLMLFGWKGPLIVVAAFWLLRASCSAYFCAGSRPTRGGSGGFSPCARRQCRSA